MTMPGHYHETFKKTYQFVGSFQIAVNQ